MNKMTKLIALVAIMAFAGTASADLVLTGIIDGSSSSPKGIELYVDGSMNLDGYAVEIDANGGGDWYNGYTFGDVTYSNQFLYITSTDSDMISTFASATASNTIADGSFNQNGNDAIRILDASSTVVDQFGLTDSSTSWEYENSYAYRNDNTGPDGSFVESNWSIPGNDYIDDNGGDDTLAPFGTYSVPEPATMGLLGVGALALIRRRKK